MVHLREEHAVTSIGSEQLLETPRTVASTLLPLTGVRPPCDPLPEPLLPPPAVIPPPLPPLPPLDPMPLITSRDPLPLSALLPDPFNPPIEIPPPLPPLPPFEAPVPLIMSSPLSIPMTSFGLLHPFTPDV